MQRHGDLWEELTSFENLWRAYQKARRGKRSAREVEQFEYRREYELARLQAELVAGSYTPGAYREFLLHDTKPRLISAAPFRDRVVHHAWCNVVEPLFERVFIFDSYASRRGKGTHAAIARYQHFARTRRYVLKCDVRKFFPSVDHELLKGDLARKIKDVRVLALAGTIIDAANPAIDVSGFFPGDDLFTQQERRCGLPLGNQTSQFFGNVFLNPLDHFVKERLGCRAYVRYVDDFVILENDVGRLRVIRDEVERFLLTRRLWLHPTKRVISRVEDGLRFLGFLVWPEKRFLTGAGRRRAIRRLRHYQTLFHSGELSAAELTARVQAWLGHARQAQARGWLSRLFQRILFTGPSATVAGVAWR